MGDATQPVETQSGTADRAVAAPVTRRRPSGEPPPLPREIGSGTWIWVGAFALAVLAWVLFAYTDRFRIWVDERDLDLLAPIVERRTDAATTAVLQVQRAGLWWAVPIVGWSTIVALVVFRRWRHLVVYVLSLVTVAVLAGAVSGVIVRHRPVEIEILGWWEGFAHPSRPIAALCAALTGAVASLVPSGRKRKYAYAGMSVPIAVMAVAQLYLGVDHPSDVLIGVLVGVAIPIIAFRVLVPDRIFPVSYRRGRTAHLDVTGARGEAIRRAVSDQLGIAVAEVRPFNLEGSAGSTPLKLTVRGGRPLFAKLLARSHLRADRWYKLGRTLRYGQLEDESRFQNVQRLVEREDYMLRLFRSAGVPSAQPYGVVEITPDREYLCVTEFLADATEITEPEVDDAVIDDALAIVHKMWDAGLAHRDIKPANVLISEGRVHLIDVAFAESRPSPWREAVDLSNMMLVLALRAGPERVLARARLLFTEDELAEAFAASRGVTLPSDLRRSIREQGRDLLAEFRELVPDREPIKIQRWSLRRLALTAWVALLALIGIGIAVANLDSAGLL